jgi:hypothetical protein
MINFRLRTLRLLALVAALGVASLSSASAVLVTPPGLNPGDPFRLVFLTDGTTAAISDNAATYDAIVQAEAEAAGLTTYFGAPVNWQAIISTPTIAANSRLPLSTEPIFLWNGPQVAASSTNLWGTRTIANLLRPIDTTPTGTVVAINTRVWTGSYEDGSPYVPLGNTAFTQATSGMVRDYSIWITQSNINLKTDQYRLYAASPVLLAGVPEPTAALLLASILPFFVARPRPKTRRSQQS